jgi:spore photoproduct lyase
VSSQWKPSEIIIDQRVKDDPVTRSIIEKCQSVPIRYVSNAKSKTIVEASCVLASSGSTMLNKIIAGKKVLFVAPASDSRVDTKTKEDDRIVCPAYDQLKYASNGCFYQCDWCYLKITHRANQPYITVYADYDRIIRKLEKRISDSTGPIMFSSGDLADSLALEHLTGAARKFIPWFGKTDKGYLFMLTKSDNVDEILDLNHNGHTIIAWSINNDRVSRKFEIGAPPFLRRLIAAKKVQRVGYPVRLRLDPIVPINGWQKDYAQTVKNIFDIIQPDRITLGTLRFEPEFYKLRKNIFAEGSDLPKILEEMRPMFETKRMSNGKESVGKYSYTEEKRLEIYSLIIGEIRKYSDCPIALCKESARVWDGLGLDRSKCSCVCQYNYVNMS